MKEALSRNVCRCTGYKKIIEAVAEYAKKRRDRPFRPHPAPWAWWARAALTSEDGSQGAGHRR
ncbi:MAG: hypothetical protein IPI05_06805 [Flavobacteriales bacterium]|nr:hypothetical protein [Flavobacteriales bacterium]